MYFQFKLFISNTSFKINYIKISLNINMIAQKKFFRLFFLTILIVLIKTKSINRKDLDVYDPEDIPDNHGKNI